MSAGTTQVNSEGYRPQTVPVDVERQAALATELYVCPRCGEPVEGGIEHSCHGHVAVCGASRAITRSEQQYEGDILHWTGGADASCRGF